MDLRLIDQAIALARHRSFAAAAKALHLSQPTLSRGIAALEESLGVRLFDRGRGQVEPTLFGRLLLERGAALLADEAALRCEIRQLAGLEAGELVVGAGPMAASISVGLAMTRFLEKHPQVRARIARSDPEQIARDVLAGRCDVGVADLGVSNREARLAHEPLPPHPIRLFARPDHPLAGRTGLRLDEVLGFPLVGSRARGSTAARLPVTSPAGRVDPDSGDFLPAIHVDSLDLARRIAASTAAIVPAVRETVAADLRDGTLVPIDFEQPWMQTSYEVFWRADRTQSPAARAFVDELRAVESEIGGATAKCNSDATHRVARARQPDSGQRGSRPAP